MKTDSFYLIAFLLLTVVSCQKEGVFNPNQKINKEYESTSNVPKTHVSTWIWDKNKLTGIEYSNFSYKRFIYNGKKIEKIISSNKDYIKYIYKGAKIEKLEYYVDGKLSADITFTHDGKRIRKALIQEYEIDKLRKLFYDENPVLAIINPRETTIFLEKLDKRSTNKARLMSFEIVYEWSGNNVKSITYQQMMGSSIYRVIYDYTYDKKNNPFYGLITDYGLEYKSKNNIVKVGITDVDNSRTEFVISYRYDSNDYPVEMTSIMNTNDGMQPATIYYEYL